MVAVPQQLSHQQSIEFQLREPEMKQLDIVIRLEHAESGKRALLRSRLVRLGSLLLHRRLCRGRPPHPVTISDASPHEQIRRFCGQDSYLSLLPPGATALPTPG
jgi:hypothetical protein